MLGYKPTEKAFNEWLEESRFFDDFCTTQEYFEYYIGIPTAVLVELFDINNIEYLADFKPNHQQAMDICLKIIKAKVC